MVKRWRVPVVALVLAVTAVLIGQTPSSSQAADPSFHQIASDLVSVDEEGNPFVGIVDVSSISPDGKTVAIGRLVYRSVNNTTWWGALAVKDLESGSLWPVGKDITFPGPHYTEVTSGGVTNDGMVILTSNLPLPDLEDTPGWWTYAASGPDRLASLDVGTPGGWGDGLDASADGSVVAAWADGVPTVLNGDGIVTVEGGFDASCGDEDTSQELTLSPDGRSLFVVVDLPECGAAPGTTGARHATWVARLPRSGESGAVQAELIDFSVVRSNWDASVSVWAPHAGSGELAVYDRATGVSLSVPIGPVDGPVEVVDVSADGQFALIHIGGGVGIAVDQIRMIDLGTGDQHTIATLSQDPNRPAWGLEIADFGRVVLWGTDDAPFDRFSFDQSLFVERYAQECDVAAGHRHGDDWLLMCSSGRVFGYLNGLPVGSASWQAPDGGIDLLAGTDEWRVRSPSGSGGQPYVALIGDLEQGRSWRVTADGGVFTESPNKFYGSASHIALNQPIVTAMATPDLGGYWLIASDGGVFSFGNAEFHGSTGAIRLVSPIVAGHSTPSGNGYWLAAGDGGVFSFGDADFFGSAAGTLAPDEAVVDIGLLDAGGYWLLTNTGRFINFPV
ncbi:MAG: hypothetical protein GY708_22585 [Actinomycetia bacterium]|nr:hypothetical protein [Actinomycetes bacterium]